MYIERLPVQTFNTTPFALTLMTEHRGDAYNWTCKYFSHFIQEQDSRFPMTRGNTPEDAAKKMYEQMKESHPKYIKLIEDKIGKLPEAPRAILSPRETKMIINGDQVMRYGMVILTQKHSAEEFADLAKHVEAVGLSYEEG